MSEDMNVFLEYARACLESDTPPTPEVFFGERATPLQQLARRRLRERALEKRLSELEERVVKLEALQNN